MEQKAARRVAIQAEINRLIGELAELATDPAPATLSRTVEQRRPLRQYVLDVLEFLGVASLSREVGAFIGAVYGVDVDPTRFGSLRREEMKAYDNGKRPRTLSIAYALTHRGEAIKRLLCRSDWPLAERVVAPTTGRVQHLRMTLRLCEFALNERNSAVRPDALDIMVADHARDLPGVKFTRGNFPFAEWRERAAALLAETADRDREDREALAKRLSMFDDERLLLFGTEKAAADTRIDPPITSLDASMRG